MPTITTKQAADLTGRHEETIREAIREGRISSAKRSGRTWVMGTEELLEVFPRKDGRTDVLKLGLSQSLEEDGEYPGLEESKAVTEYWKGKQAEARYRKEAGELVDAAEVALAYADEVTTCRERLRLVPDRLRSRVDISPKAFELLKDLITEALEDLGRGGTSHS